MGNRESQLTGSCSSASDADFLDSSTDSSYVSSYVALHRKQQQQQLQKKRDPRASFKAPPSLRLSLCSSGTQNSDSDDLTPRSWLQQSPDSPAAASDLCSILNHHHDDQPTVALHDFDSSDKPPVMPRCACRRSLSTGTGDQQQQQQQQRTAPLLLPQRPRILPIVRNGRQLSDDIYWVLPPRRKQQQLDEQRLSSSSASEDHTCCQPASFCGPGCTPLELVRRVTSEVFGVTDEESYLALSLHHWDTEKASRYLKIEQLFRLGVCDRLRCQRLLEMHSWKLDSVVQQLSRQRLCRSESH